MFYFGTQLGKAGFINNNRRTYLVVYGERRW